MWGIRTSCFENSNKINRRSKPSQPCIHVNRKEQENLKILTFKKVIRDKNKKYENLFYEISKAASVSFVYRFFMENALYTFCIQFNSLHRNT